MKMYGNPPPKIRSLDTKPKIEMSFRKKMGREIRKSLSVTGMNLFFITCSVCSLNAITICKYTEQAGFIMAVSGHQKYV